MDFSVDVTLLLTLIVSGLLCYMSLRLFWKTGKLPPGPTPLPVLGNVLQLGGGNIVSVLLKLRETYGDVFTVYFGSRPVIVVTGYKAVKEIYVDRADDFLARGNVSTFEYHYKNYGIAFTSDLERWRELRRFSLSTLRDLGMGKRSVEDHIQEEGQRLVAELKKTKESFVNPETFLVKAAGNVIYAILFGKHHDYEDAELLTMLNSIKEILHIISSAWGQLFEMFPRIMPFIPGKHQKILSSMEEVLNYVNKKVEMNKKTLDPNDARDYVDSFLIKMEKEKNNPQSEYHITNLVNSTLQIFIAGVETTSTTLTYALLLLLKYPEVLAKIYKEIDQVIGHDHLPKMQNRNQMPYTDAVIHEILRFSDILPMGVPRKTPKDVEYRGYFLPKDTNVFPMLSSVLKDPTCFPFPNEFNPTNFLDENGDFKKNDAFMPLAAGKRNCLGESLARMELFLLLVFILQNFTLKSEVPKEDLDITPAISGLTNSPQNYTMAFIPR